MENNGEHRRQRALMYADDELLLLLQELHNPTEENGFYCYGTLSLVEKLTDFATETIGERTKSALLEEDEIRKPLKHNNLVGQLIGSISSQVTREILNGNDAHTITIGVLKDLRDVSWGTKVILTLTAFGVTFADFWHLVRIYANNAVIEPMTADQREPTTANKDAYKIQIDANNDFIKCLFGTCRCLSKIVFLPSTYVQEVLGIEGEPYMHTSGKSGRLPVFVYWMMRGAMVAATQIILLSSRGLDQYLVGFSEPKEFDKLKSLSKELTLKLSYFEDRKRKWLSNPNGLSGYEDIVEMMTRVINPEKDLHPLYHSVTKRKDNLGVLKGKRVLLLISGLNIAPEDITNIKHVTIDSERDEIVWIPILKHSISSSDEVKNQLETLQNSMPWYSIHQPSLIEEAAIEAIRIEWGFKDGPMLVVLGLEANVYTKVYNQNAIFMVRIWQDLPVDNLSFGMERQLWEKETWNLKLLVNGIDPIIQEWIRDERYILMYGSNDIDWIRNFISQAHTVARNLLIHVEMIYVGNRHNKDHGCKVQDVIMTEKMSHCLPESSRAYFWSRINSMIESQKKFRNKDEKLSQEILKFNSREEWVLLAKGSTIIGQRPGRIAMTALEEIEKWRTMSLK